MEQLPTEIISRIDALAAKLGITTEFIFKSLQSDGLLRCICLISMRILGLSISFWLVYRAIKVDGPKYGGGFDHPVPIVFLIVGLLGLFISFGSLAATMSDGNLFPTSYAINALAKLFHGGK